MTTAPTRRSVLRATAWTVPAITLVTAAPARAASVTGTFDASGVVLRTENGNLGFTGVLRLTAPAAATVITATVDRVGDEDLYSWGGPQDWSAAQPMENTAGGYALHPVLHYTRSVAAGSTSVPFESHIDGGGPDVVIAYDPAWRSGPYVVTFSAPGYTTSTPLLSDETGGI